MRNVQDAYAHHDYTHAVIFERTITAGQFKGTQVRDRVRFTSETCCQNWIDKTLKDVQRGVLGFTLDSTEIVTISK